MSMLTFLNMVIAIMGDTFGRVCDEEELNALKENTSIYADFMPIIFLSKQFKEKKYLYVITKLEKFNEDQVQEADDDEQQVNQIQDLKGQVDSLKSVIGQMNLMLLKQQKEIKDLTETVEKSDLSNF